MGASAYALPSRRSRRLFLKIPAKPKRTATLDARYASHADVTPWESKSTNGIDVGANQKQKCHAKSGANPINGRASLTRDATNSPVGFDTIFPLFSIVFIAMVRDGERKPQAHEGEHLSAARRAIRAIFTVAQA